MELVGLGNGVEVLAPAHVSALLHATGWEVRVVESARVLRKIKFLNIGSVRHTLHKYTLEN